MAQTTLVTAEQLFEMCEKDRFELVEGVLAPMSPPPGFRHGQVIMNLSLAVGSFVRDAGLGTTTGAETGYRLRRTPIRFELPTSLS